MGGNYTHPSYPDGCCDGTDRDTSTTNPDKTELEGPNDGWDGPIYHDQIQRPKKERERERNPEPGSQRG